MQRPFTHKLWNSAPPVLAWTLVFCGLYLSSRYNYLLFHSLVEIFSILVAFVIFVLVWNTRRILDNNYLLFIGIASLFAGGLDLAHTLAYKGMAVFPGYDANLPTQFWIAFRGFFSLSFLFAPFFIKKTVNPEKTFAILFIITAGLVSAIFLGYFPDCYIEGIGLTPFKIISEYVIVAFFLTALGLLYKHGSAFDKRILRLLAISLLSSVAAELSFTQYVSVFGFANLTGHLFELFSYYLIYKSIVVTGIVEPSSILFRNLKLSEEKIRESEERYRSLVELSPDAIAVHCKEKYVYINTAGAKLFGATDPEDIVGRSVLDLIHPAFRERINEEIVRSYGQRVRIPVRELKIIRLDGSAVDVEAASTPVTYNGKPATQVVIRDITGRKQAQEALRAGEQRFRTMADWTYDWEYWIDRNKNIVYTSPSAERITGFTGGELTADPTLIDRIVHPEDRKKWDSHTALHMNPEHADDLTEIEFRILARNGKTLWIGHVCRSIFSETNEFIGRRVSNRDITERKQAEEALIASEAKYRSLFENMIEGFALHKIVVDDKGKPVDYVFLEANPAFERLTGLMRDDFIGKRVTAVLPGIENDPADWIGLYGRVALTGEEVEFEQYSAGLGKWFAVSAYSTMKDHFAATFQDITERKLAEQALEEQRLALEQKNEELAAVNKELQTFSYSVSHDLRAPLRHITGFIELLNRRAGQALDEKNKHFLEVISNSAKRMDRLIEDLLSFSRTGRAEMNWRTVDCNILVQETIQGLSSETKRRKIAWDISTLPEVVADPVLLGRVWMNLIENALKFTRPRDHAKIEIGAEDGKDEYIFCVQDNGVGFDMKYRDKLFAIFQRLHGPEDFEGTGIGLANVQRIIRRHGGRVWAEGAPGKGATFFFSIPKQSTRTR